MAVGSHYARCSHLRLDLDEVALWELLTLKIYDLSSQKMLPLLSSKKVYPKLPLPLTPIITTTTMMMVMKFTSIY